MPLLPLNVSVAQQALLADATVARPCSDLRLEGWLQLALSHSGGQPDRLKGYCPCLTPLMPHENRDFAAWFDWASLLCVGVPGPSHTNADAHRQTRKHEETNKQNRQTDKPGRQADRQEDRPTLLRCRLAFAGGVSTSVAQTVRSQDSQLVSTMTLILMVWNRSCVFDQVSFRRASP